MNWRIIKIYCMPDEISRKFEIPSKIPSVPKFLESLTRESVSVQQYSISIHISLFPIKK